MEESTTVGVVYQVTKIYDKMGNHELEYITLEVFDQGSTVTRLNMAMRKRDELTEEREKAYGKSNDLWFTAEAID